jgi:membrane-associated phospholipid phosphatase
MIEAFSFNEPSAKLLERIILTTGLVTFFVLGYFGVASSVDPSHVHTLATTIDKKIPFLAGSIWMYLWVFPAAISPIFVIKCPYMFRRTAIAYGVTIAISFLFFIMFPTTSDQLRATPAMLDDSQPSHWAVSVLYSLDPPYNLFPSLHLSVAAIAAFSVWKASRLYGIPLFLSIGFVSVAVCTVKQHYLLDVLGGLALATALNFVIIRPYHPLDGDIHTYSWRGPALYLAFTTIFYTSLYFAYLLKS